MPATQDFYVNHARAAPLFVVTAAATEGLLTMMEQELLPEIRFLAGVECGVTVIFDREGWSPKTFARWYDLGFDVLTCRKGKQSTWRPGCFHEVAQTVDGRRVVCQLAERRVRLSHGLRVREVRRLTEDRHQTAVITTNGTLTATGAELSQYTDVELFRIKIWDRDAGDAVVYDNRLGEAEDSDGGTVLGGGNVSVHAQAAAKLAAIATPMAHGRSRNHPNPSNPSTQIAYQLPEAGTVSLVICGTPGQPVRRLVEAPRREGGTG
ncbi:MAG: putative transposase [Candidatus Latescibacterota bacterium]